MGRSQEGRANSVEGEKVMFAVVYSKNGDWCNSLSCAIGLFSSCGSKSEDDALYSVCDTLLGLVNNQFSIGYKHGIATA